MQHPKQIAVVGCGPAGLLAATVLAQAGQKVDLFDAMPSAGRKLLVAGRGGLNLTNIEEPLAFAARYGLHSELFTKFLSQFSSADLRTWLQTLQIETYAGSSGRIFPKEAGAAELLKACLEQLHRLGVTFHFRHRWLGFAPNKALLFQSAAAPHLVFPADAVLLALGGASWPQTGSDGAWAPVLKAKGVCFHRFKPANCGFEVAWSDYFRSHFAGTPLKNLHLSCGDSEAIGEAMVTEYGLEGGGIYLLGASLRQTLEREGRAVLVLDLKRDVSPLSLAQKLGGKRGRETLANFLRKRLHLTGPAYSLLRELCSPEELRNPALLAHRIKNLEVPITGIRPLAEAISSAGGICFSELNDDLMLLKLPGVFMAGEMLDWEAPTGGYLLQGAFSTGYCAAQGIIRWLGIKSD